MYIKLSPQRRDDTLTVLKQGDALTVNGEVFDFSSLPEGGVLPSDAINSQWFVGDVSRNDGQLALTLVLPCGPNATEALRFPADMVALEDGLLTFPSDKEQA